MRWLIAFVISLAVAIASMTGAGAQDGPLGNDQQGGDLNAGAGGSGPDYFVDVTRYGAGSLGVGSSDIACTYQVFDYGSYQAWWGGFPGAPSGPIVEEGDPGSEDLFANDWVLMICFDSGGGLVAIDGFQIGEPPDAAPMLEHARRSLRIPLPVASFSPEASAPQVVGLQTWVWVDAASAADQSATACIPDSPPYYACATITASFVDVAFSMGDGTPELNCEGPGTAYDLGLAYGDQADIDHCSHIYLEADPGGSTHDVVATTIWHLQWDCVYDDGADGTLNPTCGSGDLGLIGRAQAPQPLAVYDLQARAIEGSR
jgi:hypothetical protein